MKTYSSTLYVPPKKKGFSSKSKSTAISLFSRRSSLHLLSSWLLDWSRERVRPAISSRTETFLGVLRLVFFSSLLSPRNANAQLRSENCNQQEEKLLWYFSFSLNQRCWVSLQIVRNGTTGPVLIAPNRKVTYWWMSPKGDFLDRNSINTRKKSFQRGITWMLVKSYHRKKKDDECFAATCASSGNKLHDLL